jgi:hypothetical protein
MFSTMISAQYLYLLLAIGPVAGLISLKANKNG